MSDNGNGNGQKKRVRAQSVDTRDARQYCFAVLENGGVLLADQHLCEESDGGTHWTTVWNDVPTGTAIIRVTRFTEGRGFWEPLQLPTTQTDQQVLATEKLLRLHGLSLISEVGPKGTGRRVV